jgi:hypothetical protein
VRRASDAHPPAPLALPPLGTVQRRCAVRLVTSPCHASQIGNSATSSRVGLIIPTPFPDGCRGRSRTVRFQHRER